MCNQSNSFLFLIGNIPFEKLCSLVYKPNFVISCSASSSCFLIFPSFFLFAKKMETFFNFNEFLNSETFKLFYFDDKEAQPWRPAGLFVCLFFVLNCPAREISRELVLRAFRGM